MAEAISFSAVALLADVFAAAIAGLDRLGEERGLSTAELAQRATIDECQTTALVTRPLARSGYVTEQELTLFRAKVWLCAQATVKALPLADLLGMRSAVPADWHRLPVTIDSLLWLGASRLADDLSRICASGYASPKRQQQLAAIHDLKGALGRAIRAELKEKSAQGDRTVSRRITKAFDRAAAVIEGTLPAIHAEAGALKASPR